MLRPEYIQQRLTRKPFEPVRVVASEGLRYEIYHPEMVMVGDRDITIGISRHGGTIYDRQIRIAIVHIVGLEDLPPVPATDAAHSDEA